jgi:hypothetical protein
MLPDDAVPDQNVDEVIVVNFPQGLAYYGNEFQRLIKVWIHSRV